MIPLDASSVFIGWAAGSLAWLAVVNRRRTVTFGGAWPIRVAALLFAALALGSAAIGGWEPARDLLSVLLAVLAAVALGTSIVHHRAHRAAHPGPIDQAGDSVYPPADLLDAVAAVVGFGALLAGIHAAGGPAALATARGVVGSVTLGGVTFAMVFSHRLLAKPYLGREPFEVATNGLLAVWPVELIVMVWPTGMFSVLSGAVDDGFMGILGWMWAMCAVATAGLLIVTRVILSDPEHSKLASATGMMYLAALTGAGAVLIARAVLAG